MTTYPTAGTTNAVLRRVTAQSGHPCICTAPSPVSDEGAQPLPSSEEVVPLLLLLLFPPLLFPASLFPLLFPLMFPAMIEGAVPRSRAVLLRHSSVGVRVADVFKEIGDSKRPSNT